MSKNSTKMLIHTYTFFAEDKAIFNYWLRRARCIIENTFGILASRWRIFRCTIIAEPKRAVVYTKAAIGLHIFCRQQSLLLTTLLVLLTMKMAWEYNCGKLER